MFPKIIDSINEKLMNEEYPYRNYRATTEIDMSSIPSFKIKNIRSEARYEVILTDEEIYSMIPAKRNINKSVDTLLTKIKQTIDFYAKGILPFMDNNKYIDLNEYIELINARMDNSKGILKFFKVELPKKYNEFDFVPSLVIRSKNNVGFKFYVQIFFDKYDINNIDNPRSVMDVDPDRIINKIEKYILNLSNEF